MVQGIIKKLFGGIAATLIVALPFVTSGMPAEAAEDWTTELKRELAEDEIRLISLLKAGKWDDILKEARGQSMNWWMYAKDPAINKFASQWVAERVKKKYGINLKQVSIKDTVEGVNQIVNEKNAGKHTGGSVDLNWISKVNFRTLKQGEMLFVNWGTEVPNAKYIDFNDSTISHHGLIFVGNDVLPWSRFQYVFIYNSDKVKNVPKSWQGVFDWCMAHPGKFTYPAPPHFTGRGILFSLLYEISGGSKMWEGKFDKSLWEKWSPKMWKFLNDMKPCLWRRGETYPETIAVQDQLYGAGELDWSMTAYYARPGRNVDKGLFPKSTRTSVIDIGTVTGTGALSIPYNSSSKAAALVVANFLASPEAQYQKALPTVVGDGTILSIPKLTKEWQDKFKNMPKHPATVATDVLGAHQVPYGTDYINALEQDWRKFVLKKP
jgi:putative spermidine/putrescine transport system substrate-binding protein